MREDIGALKAMLPSTWDEVQVPVLPILSQTDNFGKDSSPEWNKADRQSKQTPFTLSVKAGEDALCHTGRESCDQGWHQPTPSARAGLVPWLPLPPCPQQRCRTHRAQHGPCHTHSSSYQHIAALHQELDVEWTRDGKSLCNLFCSSFYLLKNQI